jgi:hypothetical protein
MRQSVLASESLTVGLIRQLNSLTLARYDQIGSCAIKEGTLATGTT